jgi:acetyl esterase/lipase
MQSSPDRRALLAALSLSACATAPADSGIDAALRDSEPDEILPLWPGEAPGGANDRLVHEVVADRPNDLGLRDRAVQGVVRPVLSLFRPARPDGSALLIVPGGGYRYVVIDKEGYETARWFAARGVASYVLRYRLPDDGWAAGPDVALQDAQRAMRVIRAHRGVDPARVALVGFSAGGHVAAQLAARFDAPLAPDGDARPARPDITCLMYPVITMGEDAHAGSRDRLLGPSPSAAMIQRYSMELHARPDMSPTLLVHAADDASVLPANSMAMYDALGRAGVGRELHMFEEGGHGFGLRLIRDKPVAAWPALFHAWGRRHGVCG